MKDLLEKLKIKADIIKIYNNESIVRYYLKMRPDGKISKIEQSLREIALNINSYNIPTIKIIPQKGLICLEALISPPKDVLFSELSNISNFDKELPVILGKTYDGDSLIFDLAKAPHLLIAGTTGSGKSVMLHSIICSLIKLDNIKLALVDPKNVEFSVYNNIKQLMYPVVNYANDSLEILSDLVIEMDNRFKLMASSSVNNIIEYNKKKTKKSLSYIILIIDEFSDLMQISKKEFQLKLSRLAQKARACGIHIVIATQRPSADVITGSIKANFPARIGCKVTSIINSRVVLEQKGAETLLGKGDAILNAYPYDMVRFQGAFVSNDQIKKLCNLNKISKISYILNRLRGAL